MARSPVKTKKIASNLLFISCVRLVTDVGFLYRTNERKLRFIIIVIAHRVSERGDSNARPLRPERSALPTALLSDCVAKVQIIYELWIMNDKLFSLPRLKRLLKGLKITFGEEKMKYYKKKRKWFCGFKNSCYLCTRKTERCHSSVGRAKDWKSLCPRFDSWWHHNQKSYKTL